MKVLIDSSVWIPFLRGHSELPNEVSVAMSEGKAHLCPVVWVEIFRGIRGKREERIAKELSALVAVMKSIFAAVNTERNG